MRRTGVRCVLAVWLTCVAFFLVGHAIPAIVLTTTGQIADGTLAGLGPILRLLRSDDVEHVGPDNQYDVPLSSILQISLDFPRVIVETTARTLIGPYSAFLGIDEILRLNRGTSGSVDIPTASLRAIALNGHSLRSVPREWTGMGFLTKPEIFGATPLVDTECDGCSISLPDYNAPTGDGDVPIWNIMTPNLPPDGGGSELPWWVGLLGVVGIIGLFYVLSSTGSSP